MVEQYFQGKVAVVTGAAGIICSEVSKDLASLGIFVVLADRAIENAQRIAEEIRANGGRCAAYACDVTDKAAVDAFADEVMGAYGRCDFLINGAGGNNAKAQPKIVKFDPRVSRRRARAFCPITYKSLNDRAHCFILTIDHIGRKQAVESANGHTCHFCEISI